MWGNKDGIDYLIKAFHKIQEKHKNTKLYLIGDISDKKQFLSLKSTIENMGLTEKIIFTGKLRRNDMPKYLKNAAALVLSRPTSLLAEGGFPTKLGEYLATGNPVVITKVGDIPRYLKDRENAFLAEPDSVDSFANKLDEVLSDMDFAKIVGEKGKELAYGVFHYKTQAKRIAGFISTL